MKAILLACCALAAAPALAADDDANALAEKHKRAAFTLLRENDYAGGIAEMKLAYAAVPHPDFLFNIAVAYAKWDGHCGDAIAAYARFLDACGECERASVARAKYGELHAECAIDVELDVDPPGSSVVIDGAPSASAVPVVAKLTPGEHRVLVVARGGDVRASTIKIPPRRVRRVLISAQPEARILLANAPPETMIQLGEQTFGGRNALPPAIAVAPGKALVRVFRGSNLDWMIDLEIAAGQTFELDLGGAPRSDPAPRVPPPEPVRAASPEPESNTDRWVWAAFGGSAIAAIASAALFGSMLDTLDREEQAHMTGPDEVVNSLRDQSNREALLGQVALGAAIGCAATGVALLLWGD